jgi:branched-chain amino acid aminotransferase/4-amino-4-deoxychorismate lyase
MRRALALAGLDEARAAVRVTWTAGSGGRGLDRPARPAPRLSVTAAAAAKPVGPARLALSSVRRNDQSPASRLKTLAYLDNVLARAEARDRGADEAVMLNTAGEVACAAAANLFWLAGDRLFTPALACGVLAGVTRATVIAAAPALGLSVAEVRAGPEALSQADAVFLTNSLIGVRSVSDFEGRAIGVSDLARRLDGLV